MATWIKVTCPSCGVEFEIPGGVYRRKYCRPECHYAWRSRAMVNNPATCANSRKGGLMRAFHRPTPLLEQGIDVYWEAHPHLTARKRSGRCGGGSDRA